jgi:hypothetical protein
MGGELRDDDGWTLSLLANPEVLEVHQEGSRPRLVSHKGAVIVWASEAPGGSTNVALFNTGESPMTVVTTWENPGIDGAQTVRDAWERNDLVQAESKLGVQLPPNGSTLLKLTKA